MTALRLLVGAGLTIAGWLLTRASAGALGSRRWAGWAFDALVAASMFCAVLLATMRPVFAGVLAGGALAAIAFADTAKRRFLGEPVVFTDLGVLPELLRHSELYIAFVGYGRMLGGAAAVLSALALLLWREPPLTPWPPAALALAVAAVAAAVWLGANPLLPLLAAGLRRFRVEEDPVADSRALGLAGVQFIHGVVARRERPARVAALAPPQTAVRTASGGRPAPAPSAPVILVQLESFFDPVRLDPSLELPAWSGLEAEALMHGRITVPGLGGNTMRTEFEVLSGRRAEALGLDRLHPYQALARRPIDSLAWRLKARGYRTVALHPYDRTFYRRHRALPNLGFDRFLGAESFRDAPRNGRYVADTAVAEAAARVIEEEGPGVFLFLITMGAHGPWRRDPALRLPGLSEEAVCGVGDWRRRLDDTGAALERLAGLASSPGEGLLALYGDHLPSLPALWEARPMPDRRTDHLLWSPGRAGPPGARRDLHAADLGACILEALPR